MSLIASVTLDSLKRKTVEEVKDLPCVEITHNGEYIGTFIVPCVRGGMSIYDYTKTQAEYLGVQSNSTHITQGVMEDKPFVCECGASFGIALALAGHRRTHKKELVEV